jgi:chemotaxis response regulator CheB
VVGVVLSGGGDDGVDGLIAIKGKGGISIVQRPDEARRWRQARSSRCSRCWHSVGLTRTPL